MTLDEIRKKYPAYQSVDDATLAKSLHKKYYPQMDFTEFSAKVGLEAPRTGQIQRTRPSQQHPAYHQQTLGRLSESLDANTPVAGEDVSPDVPGADQAPGQPAGPLQTGFGMMSPFAGVSPSAPADTLEEKLPPGQAAKQVLIENYPSRGKQYVGGLLQAQGERAPQRMAGLVQAMGEDRDDAFGWWNKAQALIDAPMETMRLFMEKDMAGESPYFQFRDWAKAKGEDLFQSGRKEVMLNQPQKLNASQQWFIDAARALEDMGLAVGAGMATRSTAPVLTIMGGQVYGKEYGEGIEMGLDPYKASARAKVHTLAEIVPEQIPAFAIINKSPGARAFLEASLGEGAQEGLTSVIQQTYDAGQLENMSLKEALLNIDWKQAGREVSIGVGVGTSLYGATKGVQSYQRYADEKIKKGEMPIGYTGAMFAGRKAKTANIGTLDLAQAAEQEGTEMETIRQQTGWHKGKDDQWRFEIDDSQTVMKKPFPRKGQPWGDIYNSIAQQRVDEGRDIGITVGEMIDHPSLFEAYPQLESLSVGTKRGSGASYSAAGDMGPAEIKIGKDVPMSKVKTHLLHEIQHAIQQYEGFAKGGSPVQFEKAAFIKARQQRETLEGINLALHYNVQSREELERSKMAPGADVKAINEEINNLKNRYNQLLDTREKLDPEVLADPRGLAYEQYKRLAGEIEARNTQTRQTLSGEERRQLSPEQTADIPESEAIVHFGEGVAESRPDTGEVVNDTVAQLEQRINAAERSRMGERQGGMSDYINTLKTLRDQIKLNHTVWSKNTFGEKQSDLAKQRLDYAMEQAQQILQAEQNVPTLTETPNRQTRGGMAGGMGPVSPRDVMRPQAPREVAGTDLGPFLDKLNTTDDAKELMARVTQMFEGTMEDARRGTVSWEETERLAEQYLGDTSFLTGRKKGDAFNASQIEASRAIIDQGLSEVLEAAERASTGTDADLVDFQNKLDTFVPLAQQVLGARAEAGRALNILKKQAMQAKQMKSVLETIGGRDAVEAKAEALRHLKEQGLPKEQLSQAAAQLQKPTAMDMIIEAWINALLSGPQTHAVNMSSNFLVASFTLPEHMLAGMIGKLHGGNKVYMREAIARTWGMLQGIKDGALAFGKTVLTEETTDPLSKLESRRYQAIPGPIGKFVRIPGRFLQAEDELFKGIGRRMEVKTRALRQALEENAEKPYERARQLEEEVYELIGQDRPETMTDEQQIIWDIWDQAYEGARYQTFTNELGVPGKQIQRLINQIPVPLKFIAPFVRTPTNIVKFAGHRSPFALTMPSFWRMMKEGGAARDVAIARAMMGTGLASFMMYLAAEGLITGGGPEDPNERRVWLQKYKPYSFYDPKTNEYKAYSRLEPLGMIVGISADFSYVLNDLEEKEAGDIALQLHTSIIKNLTSKTFLRGITDFINMYSDPERYGNWWIQSFAGTAIPTGIAQVARTQDPVLRRTETVLQRLRSRAPYLSKDLMPRLNVWGEPIVLGGGLGPDIISPIYLGTDPHDPVINEMLRLDYYPGRISRTIGGVELSAEQHNEYIRIAGQEAKERLHRYVQSPMYQNNNDAVRERILERVFDKTRELARKRVLLNNPDLREQIKQKRLEKREEMAQ